MPGGLLRFVGSIWRRLIGGVPLKSDALLAVTGQSNGTLVDSVGVQDRDEVDDYAVLGDGVVTITFNTNLVGETFTYYNGQTQVASQTLSSQVWTVPTGEYANYFEFSNGSKIIVPNTGDILFDLGIDGYHALVSDSLAVTAQYAHRNVYNDLGYSTVQYYIDKGGDGNIYLLGSLAPLDVSVLIPNTDLFRWEFDSLLGVNVKVAT